MQIGEVELLGLPDPAAVPTVLVQPANVTANEGSTATFSVSATGPGTLTYQWYNVTAGDPGTPVVGQTSATLTLPNVTAAMNGNLYRVVINSQYGGVIAPATCRPGGPTDRVERTTRNPHRPGPRRSCLCRSHSHFAVAISGTEPFTLQWQKNGSNLRDTSRITGSQSNMLTIVNSQPDSANYQLATIQRPRNRPERLQALTVQTVPALTPNGAGWALNGTPTPAPINAGVLELTANRATPPAAPGTKPRFTSAPSRPRLSTRT